MKTEILLVSCCLEPSRTALLKKVVENLDSISKENITVFDNASTEPGVRQLLIENFSNVFQSNTNVGYWTAIDWWLRRLDTSGHSPDYTYIIESDMIHYGLDKLNECADFLDRNPNLGGMRLHEYSVENFRYYDKDSPIPGSRSGLWQSHRNRVTNKAVKHEHVEGPFWKTNFLTQLPALNRYAAMSQVFASLHATNFTELEFQRLYHKIYPENSLLDGGMYHCDLNPYGSDSITGSWTSPEQLAKIGYHSTRYTSILSPDKYDVKQIF